MTSYQSLVGDVPTVEADAISGITLGAGFVTHFSVCNTTSSTISVSVLYNKAGTTKYLMRSIEVPGNATLVCTDGGKWYVGAGDALRLIATSAGLSWYGVVATL